MASQIMSYAHSLIDYSLGVCKLVQYRQVGWLTQNRKTGEIIRERQPLLKKLKLLLLFNPVTEWIDRTRWVRYYLHEHANHEGKIESDSRSVEKIRAFVDFYGIDMEQFDPSAISSYSSFQDFFVRKHKSGTRPTAASNDPSVAIVVADCRVVVFDTVADTHKLWIKGRNFSVARLITDKVAARTWANGAVASFRLSPQDYHRYHSPVSGTVKWWKEIDGDYYAVDPIAVRSDVDVLAANARSAFCLVTREFGDVLFVAVGASDVGSVRLAEKAMTPGASIDKGEEVGWFEFGGSSIVVAFEPGRIEFDKDLKDTSAQLIEMDVEVGMRLGKATMPLEPLGW